MDCKKSKFTGERINSMLMDIRRIKTKLQEPNPAEKSAPSDGLDEFDRGKDALEVSTRNLENGINELEALRKEHNTRENRTVKMVKLHTKNKLMLINCDTETRKLVSVLTALTKCSKRINPEDLDYRTNWLQTFRQLLGSLRDRNALHPVSVRSNIDVSVIGVQHLLEQREQERKRIRQTKFQESGAAERLSQRCSVHLPADELMLSQMDMEFELQVEANKSQQEDIRGDK